VKRGVRVIAGSARGRRLVVPEGDRVRPTKDIVREAVFSALDARGAIDRAHVLDLYAGSGALAIEALSRGATDAVVVERGRAALHAINANLHMLGLGDRASVLASDVARTLRDPPPPTAPFDLVFADPPYDTTDDAIAAMLEALASPGWLATDAIVVIERPAKHPVPAVEGWRTEWERQFGDTLASFCFR
jgi:16S rRNA (guanine966-N2)-methyltransferase